MLCATSKSVSEVSARDVFTSPENLAFIKDLLLMRRKYDLTGAELGAWYDRYMREHQVEATKIEDVMAWSDYMSDQFARYWRGRHNVSAEQVPFLPFELPANMRHGVEFGPNAVGSGTMPKKNPMIVQTHESGRWPKFNLPSAVEDGVDENGEIVIHNEWQRIHMFQPITGTQGKGWRFGKNDPETMRRVAGFGTARGFDMDYRGSLYDWELLSRPHTKYPMEKFFTAGY